MNKQTQHRLPKDFDQLNLDDRAGGARARVARDGLIGTSNGKYPRQHGNVVKQKADKRQEQLRPRRRIGRAALLLTATAASVIGAGKLTAGQENPFMVNRDAISQMDDEQQEEQFNRIVVHSGDTISGLAEDYVEQHGGSAFNVRESLTVQARQIDIEAGKPMNEHVIQPGEVYYLPKN